MTELRPCPFCGTEAKLEEYSNGRFAVVCMSVNCTCFTSGNSYNTEVEAVERWNTRVSDEDGAFYSDLKRTQQLIDLNAQHESDQEAIRLLGLALSALILKGVEE